MEQKASSTQAGGDVAQGSSSREAAERGPESDTHSSTGGNGESSSEVAELTRKLETLQAKLDHQTQDKDAMCALVDYAVRECRLRNERSKEERVLMQLEMQKAQQRLTQEVQGRIDVLADAFREDLSGVEERLSTTATEVASLRAENARLKERVQATSLSLRSLCHYLEESELWAGSWY